MSRLILALCLMFSFAVAAPAQAAGPAFRVDGLGLYQPSTVLEARLGPDVQPFADYVEALKSAAAQALASAKAGPGVSGAIVVAVKPGRRAKVWLVMADDRMAPEVKGALIVALEKVPAVRAVGGPVAFSISFSAWGGGRRLPKDPVYPQPLPPSWLAAVPASGRAVIPDDILDKVWVDTPPPANGAAPLAPPPGAPADVRSK